MNNYEKQAEDYLKNKGMLLQPFSKIEMRQTKTPDFRVYKDSNFVFYCEVKSVQDTWLDEQLDKAVPGTLVGGTRNDPIPNRLSNKIHEAVQQFDSVNKDLSIPNVLIFINNDSMCQYDDLIGVFTGAILTKENGWKSIYRKYSEGRIKGEKHRIDLYVWIDREEKDYYFFTRARKNSHNLLCDCFNIDQKDIKTIPS